MTMTAVPWARFVAAIAVIATSTLHDKPSVAARLAGQRADGLSAVSRARRVCQLKVELAADGIAAGPMSER